MLTTPTFQAITRAHDPGARRIRRSVLAVAVVAIVGLLGIGSAGAAEAPVGLGVATSFAILAGAGITNTGATTIDGDVGTYATTATTGFGTVVQTGVNHGGDAVTQQAKLDLVTGYNDAAGRGPVTAATPVDLAGQVLTPGVYRSGTIELSGTLTLDAQGDPNAVFVFQAASTLVTASASTVNVINTGGFGACNIYWQVGSSATLGSASNFVGSVLASDSISLDAGAVVAGRLLAQTGAVTLINNTITNTACAAVAPTTTTTTAAVTAPTDTTPATPVGSGAGVPAGPDGAAGTPGTAGRTGRTPPRTTNPPTDRTRQLAFWGTDVSAGWVGAGAVALGFVCLCAARTRRLHH